MGWGSSGQGRGQTVALDTWPQGLAQLVALGRSLPVPGSQFKYL